MSLAFELLRSIFPRFWILLFRFIQWALLLLYYSSLISAVIFTKQFGSLSGVIPAVVTLGWILLAIVAYQQDQERESLGMDDFRDDWLFFRYGQQIDYVTISIPVKDQWGFKETQISAETLRTSLAERVARRLPFEAVQVFVRKVIQDLSTGESKEFTRVLIRSPFGSTVTMFVHYAAFGQTITAHYLTFRRGVYGFWSLTRFILASPFSIWFWGIAWLRNRYSIISAISEFRRSSFDTIDLQTMYEVAHRVLYEETASALKEVGLMTEEIQQVINYNIGRVHNLQSLAIIDSPNAAIAGNVVAANTRTTTSRQPVPVSG